MAATSGPISDLISMEASACLRGALEFAWYRDAASAGTSHVLLALVACGDPVSWPAPAEAGITYRAICGVLGEGEAPAPDGAPVSDGGVATKILADI